MTLKPKSKHAFRMPSTIKIGANLLKNKKTTTAMAAATGLKKRDETDRMSKIDNLLTESIE